MFYLVQPMSVTVKSEVSITSDCLSFGVSQSLWIKPKLLSRVDKPFVIFVALASPASFPSPSPFHSGSGRERLPEVALRSCGFSHLRQLRLTVNPRTRLTSAGLQEAHLVWSVVCPSFVISPEQAPVHATSSLLTCIFPLRSEGS